MDKRARYLRRSGKPYVEFTDGEGIIFPTIPLTTENGKCVPLNLLNLAILHQNGYTFLDVLAQKKLELQEKAVYEGELPECLMPFQAESVRKMICKSGTLLADEQGLGKTLQLITVIDKRPDLRPCVIVCPAHLKHNWKNEFAKWSKTEPVILNTRTPYNPFANVLIINYEIIQYWAQYLTDLGTKLVICDEAHRIKNRSAASTQAVLKLGDNPVRIMATGTPLVNNPENVWALVNAINPNILPGYTYFTSYFCVVNRVPIYYKGKPLIKFGKKMMRTVFTGSKNLAILNTTLASSVMIRRTKEQVLPQLPAKTKTILPIDVGLDKENKEAIDLILEADNVKVANDAYAKLYKELGTAKVEPAIQWISDFLSSSNEKLVVAGWHRDVTTAIYEKFKDDAVLIIGGVTDKEQKIRKFVEGDKRILIGNIKAAGTGLTLTAARTMLFVELPMTAADLNQMMDRIHRIGQANQCNYYYLIGKGTLEEKILGLLDRKTDMAKQVVDGVEGEELEFGNLLKEAVESSKV